jgi:hypothetical protein
LAVASARRLTRHPHGFLALLGGHSLEHLSRLATQGFALLGQSLRLFARLLHAAELLGHSLHRRGLRVAGGGLGIAWLLPGGSFLTRRRLATIGGLGSGLGRRGTIRARGLGRRSIALSPGIGIERQLLHRLGRRRAALLA